jgi:hypothetical protein
VALLRALLALEIWLGLLWVIPVLFAPRPGLEMLAVAAWTAPVHGVGMAAGLAALGRRSAPRRLAAAAVLVPVLGAAVPVLARSAAGGPIASVDRAWELTGATLVGLPLAACLVVPRAVARRLPAFVARSRALAILPVAGLAVLLLALAGIVAWAVGGGLPTSAAARPATATDLALLLLPLAGSAASLPAALAAWVLRFHPEGVRHRRLRDAQLVLALLLAGIALPVSLFLYAVLLVNPG